MAQYNKGLIFALFTCYIILIREAAPHRKKKKKEEEEEGKKQIKSTAVIPFVKTSDWIKVTLDWTK